MNEPYCYLLCGCWARVSFTRAATGNHVQCIHHGMTQVMYVKTHEWRVRCMECPYGRWFGQDEREAARAKARHKNTHPGHAVNMAYDRVTADGKGTQLRYDNSRRRNSTVERDTLLGEVDAPPPPF